MNTSPQSSRYGRSTRVRLADVTPTVLRFEDGRLVPGTLEKVSMTGGLLSVSSPVTPGLRAKLMFLARTGPVLGAAEMLDPVTVNQQPFRFVALRIGDQRRLRAAIDLCAYPGKNEQEWIEKYRTAVAQTRPPRRRIFRFFLAATFATICLASAFYALHGHLLK